VIDVERMHFACRLSSVLGRRLEPDQIKAPTADAAALDAAAVFFPAQLAIAGHRVGG